MFIRIVSETICGLTATVPNHGLLQYKTTTCNENVMLNGSRNLFSRPQTVPQKHSVVNCGQKTGTDTAHKKNGCDDPLLSKNQLTCKLLHASSLALADARKICFTDSRPAASAERPKAAFRAVDADFRDSKVSPGFPKKFRGLPPEKSETRRDGNDFHAISDNVSINSKQLSSESLSKDTGIDSFSAKTNSLQSYRDLEVSRNAAGVATSASRTLRGLAGISVKFPLSVDKASHNSDDFPNDKSCTSNFNTVRSRRTDRAKSGPTEGKPIATIQVKECMQRCQTKVGSQKGSRKLKPKLALKEIKEKELEIRSREQTKERTRCAMEKLFNEIALLQVSFPLSFIILKMKLILLKTEAYSKQNSSRPPDEAKRQYIRY